MRVVTVGFWIVFLITLLFSRLLLHQCPSLPFQAKVLPIPDLEYPFISEPFPSIPAGTVPRALLIYTICPSWKKQRTFSIWRATIPAVSITCNNRTVKLDCHEAVGYLTFLINHYEQPLAEKYLFVHGHDTAWHEPENVFDVLPRLLKSEYFANYTYGAIYPNVFGDRAFGRPTERRRSWAEPLYRYLFANTSMPELPIDKGNRRPCCATFFMSSELVWTRKKKEYILIRDRLREWSRQHERYRSTALRCGWLMEFTWHILFTKNASVTLKEF
jgi:hypothetical protein